ncbi:hypothetical protein [Nonomuraea sp. KM90]|uniref:hypothetical protein n=1 Tax=Nonomuraea sp. KM90 TaxID=3457428 RepID=UPI003FCE963F
MIEFPETPPPVTVSGVLAERVIDLDAAGIEAEPQLINTATGEQAVLLSLDFFEKLMAEYRLRLAHDAAIPVSPEELAVMASLPFSLEETADPYARTRDPGAQP